MKYYLLPIILTVLIFFSGCGKKAPPFIPEKDDNPDSNAVRIEIEKDNGND